MYELLFVEDEEIIRKVFPQIINWESIGITVAGSVKNGLEALEFLGKHQVDLVLTDIRMPVMNGLELAYKIKSIYPSIKTILLSAYSEFEYARKGIEYGVYGYLLKSIDEEEIENYFRKLKENLDKERLSQAPQNSPVGAGNYNNISHTGKIVEKALNYMHENFERDINLDQIAAFVNVHPVHLSRLFRQELDQTFKYVLTGIRIEKARQLLKISDMKVYEISQAVGYKKPRYFSELFKEVTGLTPLEYREGC